jgi:transposase
MEQVNLRLVKGQQLATNSQIQWCKDYYLVPSETGNGSYQVSTKNHTCNCIDFTYRQTKCKHIYAVEAAFGKQRVPDTWAANPNLETNWPAYNKSQTSEKAVFLNLLSELTRGIDEPDNATGRPALNLGDMIFSCVFKVYSQMSSRRFTTDLTDAKVKGYINDAPHYNSLNRYMEKESLTPYLEMMIEETSKPLAGLETDFAVDSTGLSISNSVAWSHAKYKDTKMLKIKNWVKVHCCIGTKTNVITGVEISDKTGGDATYFLPVLETTRKNFNVQEVSADGAYISEKHLAYSVLNNIRPFLAFRENSTTTRFSSSVWKRMYHYFQLNRAEFFKGYNKRNNAETTFHMLKSKFGSTLKSRNAAAQKNEALAKCICHNIVCLIHAMNEFGITPEFMA